MSAKKSYCYEYPKADHTVDAVVFSAAAGGVAGGVLEVLLIQRKDDPHRGAWALPGGFIGMDEDLEDAVRRELREETGLRLGRLEQLATFGKPGRDPRGRVITTVFTAIVGKGAQTPRAGSDAADSRWTPVAEVLSGAISVAFDHREIIALAVSRLGPQLA